MDYTNVLGFVAATLTTTSFIPQAFKTIRTKKTKDISLVMYSILNVGIIGWMIYGILLVNWPIIISNIITILFTSPILYYKIRYK
ncbi:MAG: SemiSWEET transporter [Bacteroidales bacterium]